MSLNLVFPKCQSCGVAVGVAIGLPVWITFDPETKTATIGVDLAEIADVEDGYVCECGNAEFAPGDFAEITDRMAELSEAQCEGKITLQTTYTLEGYGCCGACGQTHYDRPGACDLDPMHEIPEEG